MKIALLTGASSGLGYAYAKYLGEIFPQIDEIWALARRTDRLAELSKSISSPKVVPIACDLTNPQDIDALRERLDTQTPEIILLVNNAGCGFHGDFASSNEEEQMRCVQLNICALTQLTRIALGHMPAGGYILNTSSIASFSPNANMAVYSASKAYVTFFSRALNEELRPGGRSSTAVCPAPMNTEFLTVGHIKGQSKMFEMLPYCNVDMVAKGALKAARRRRSTWTPRVFYKFYRFLVRLLPDALMVRLCKT